MTERLVLRLLQLEDVPAFAAYRSDPDVARYQSWDTSYYARPTANVSSRRSKVSTSAILGRGCRWRPSNGPPGAVRRLRGAGRDRSTADRRGRRHARAREQGSGLATEALGAVVTRLFEHHDIHRVYAQADDRNGAVHRLLERLGFRCEARLVEADWFKGEWTTLRTYATLRREWRMRRGQAGAGGPTHIAGVSVGSHGGSNLHPSSLDQGLDALITVSHRRAAACHNSWRGPRPS